MIGQILVISGPSGCGKSSLISKLMDEFSDVYFSISSTTRKIRDGEQDGVNYHYISENDFKKGIDSGEFLEWAYVHKNYYGTSLLPVKKALSENKIVIFDIDVQGYNIALTKFRDIITSVFVTTPNKAILKKRLELRGSDNKEAIERRLFNAVGEMEHIREYDYFLINDDFARCYQYFRAIFETMRLKTSSINIRGIIDDWISE